MGFSSSAMTFTWAHTSAKTSALHHILLCGTSFEDVKPVNEMNHEIAGQRVGGGITDIVGGDAAAYVGSLLQDVIDLEAKGAALLLEECLLDRCIPEPFILFKTIRIAGVGGVVDIALERHVPWQIDGCAPISAIVQILLVLLAFKAVGHVIEVDVSPHR